MRIFALILASAAALVAQEPPAPSTAPLAPAVAPAPMATPRPEATAPESVDFPVLDEGLLQLKWFGPGITLQKGDIVDYYWIKPGLNLKGQTLAFEAWDDPIYLRPGRDAKDKERAQKLSDSFPGILMRGLEPAFGTSIQRSKRDGDYLLIGRMVDAVSLK